MNRNKGFSLLEIILTITILGIVSMVAVPYLPSFNNTSEVSHYENVKSFLVHAKKLSHAKNVNIFIKVEADKISACFNNDCSNIIKEFNKNLIISNPNGILNSNFIGTFAFNPSGGIDEVNNVLIKVGSYDVLIDKGSGYVY